MTARAGGAPGFAAVAFDLYGTLVRIGDDRGVTRRVARALRDAAGPSPTTTNIGLHQALMAAGVDVGTALAIADDAAAEADSVELLPGAAETMARLRDAGVPMVVASNLSREYAPPLSRLMPDVPAILSFACGWAKPAAAFYDLVAAQLGVERGRIVMIGDSRRCDHDGARDAGMGAVLLGDIDVPDILIASDVAAAVVMLDLA